MENFIIEGGSPISGTIRAQGNKNAALPAIAAALLTDQTVRLHNVPRIGDVIALLDIVSEIGVLVDWTGDDLVINAASIEALPLDDKLCRKLRGSVLLVAPLLFRRQKIALPFPGGDRIGRRRLDTHLLALSALGAEITVGDGVKIAAPRGLRGTDLWLDEASVTATENTIMAAVLAEGATTIYHAACEPHVQELCRLLGAMGANIDGVGTNRLTIVGVKNLRGAEFTLGADYLEVASLLTLAALTGGELLVENASPQYLPMILRQFRRIGLVGEVEGENLRVPKKQPLEVSLDFRGVMPTIDDAPWPGFPADLTSIAVVAATQTRGSLLIHEKMFESRLYFVDRLIEMGAKIVLCDPHRAVIIGHSPLHGAKIASPDIRAGMALLIASMCAEGESTINNIEQIDRGYETIDRRLRALGAKITRA
ncbi:MAG: UDP-N-acetylglucosamine 1-carboxyvinyltransferase [Planctomycetota bacterium]|jgi:UDP-N-acetylglucosamine 1-carboxyvinyltransferase|nr:UDP-N-acetylglucosamine 1-carboxyvinyltransferase [Planctomycetota bacterium]